MTATRNNLKTKFAAGARPTAGDFGALIDAALIMDEEGFKKTDDDGLLISSATKGDGLLSFRRRGSSEELESAWSIGFGGAARKLVLQRGPFSVLQPSLLTFDSERREGSEHAIPSANVAIAANVAIGHKADDDGIRLDVAGIVQSDGRIGRKQIFAADGEWHDITGKLSGCCAFEVLAGVHNVEGGTGRVAMMRAVAMNAFNPSRWDDLLRRKKPIHCQHAYYRRHRDRLELRWQTFDDDNDNPNRQHGLDARYKLAVRTRNAYDDGAQISVFVTQLWYGTALAGMSGALDDDQAGPAGRTD